MKCVPDISRTLFSASEYKCWCDEFSRLQALIAKAPMSSSMTAADLARIDRVRRQTLLSTPDESVPSCYVLVPGAPEVLLMAREISDKFNLR